jgi:hypothetical protein
MHVSWVNYKGQLQKVMQCTQDYCSQPMQAVLMLYNEVLLRLLLQYVSACNDIQRWNYSDEILHTGQSPHVSRL